MGQLKNLTSYFLYSTDAMNLYQQSSICFELKRKIYHRVYQLTARHHSYRASKALVCTTALQSTFLLKSPMYLVSSARGFKKKDILRKFQSRELLNLHFTLNLLFFIRWLWESLFVDKTIPHFDLFIIK